MTPDGENSIIVSSGANARVTVEDLERALPPAGPRSVVFTLGGDGAIVAERHGDGSRTTTLPAERVLAVDTTGAGDAFVGALVWRLVDGTTLPSPLRSP